MFSPLVSRRLVGGHHSIVWTFDFVTGRGKNLGISLRPLTHISDAINVNTIRRACDCALTLIPHRRSAEMKMT